MELQKVNQGLMSAAMSTPMPASGVFADAYTEEIIEHFMSTLRKWCIDVEGCVTKSNLQSRYDSSDIGPILNSNFGGEENRDSCRLQSS